MKVIENHIIPFKGFLAINLFGVAFVRKEEWQSTSPWYRRRCIIHESIHTAQMRELLYVFFYIIYFFEWLWRLVQCPSSAYRNISFEQEAYRYESDEDYLQNRKHFAQWRKNE